MTLFQSVRESRGLSQSSLAASLGIDQAYLSRLERGERSWPADVLDHLCDILGLTPEERSDALRQAGEAARARKAQQAEAPQSAEPA